MRTRPARLCLATVLIVLAAPGTARASDPAVTLAAASPTGIGDTLRARLLVEVRSEGGAPPENVEVGIAPERGGRYRRIRRGADGEFEAIVPAGAWRVSAQATGHEPTDVVVRLREGSRRFVRLVLPIAPVELPALRADVRRAADVDARSTARVDFGSRPLAWASLADWLRSEPGVQVRSGPSGGQTVSVRGSRPASVLVLLDGAPLNDPITGAADLSAIPVASLESATLVRGAATSRYGSGALAGALLLRSRDPSGTGASVTLRSGSFGEKGVDAWLASAGRAMRASLVLTGERAENDFSYENRLLPGTPEQERVNADASRMSASGRIGMGDLRASLRADALERGAPGHMGTRLYDHARWNERRWSGGAGWSGARASADLHLAGRTTRYDPGDGSAVEHTSTREWRAGLSGWIPGTGIETDAGFVAETVEGDALAGRARRLSGALRFRRNVEMGDVRLEPALSLDATDRSTVMSPALGAVWRPVTSVALRARAEQAFRMPTFGDLYFASGHRMRPNPGLRPERVTLDFELGADVGWTAGRARIEGSASVWSRRIRDPIVWMASATAVWSPQNLEAISGRGAEAHVAVAWRDASGAGAWRIAAHATVDGSHLAFGANRNPVPYRPGVTVGGTLERRSGRASLGATATWTGARTTSVAGTRTLPAFLLVDASLSVRLPAPAISSEAVFRVLNLLDARYELVELVPEPGRGFEMGIRVW